MATRRTTLFKILVMTILVAPHACFADEALDRFRMSRVKARTESYVEEARRDIERGAYMKAIRVLSEALNKGAGNEARELRARAYEAIGSKDSALKDLNQVVSSRPSDPTGYVTRADAANSMKLYEKAISDYDHAIELDPFLVDAYLGRGAAFAAIEKYEFSIRDLELALKIDQHNQEALYNMGVICMAADLPQAGRNFIKRALAENTNPTDRERLHSILNAAPERSYYEDKKGGIGGVLAELAKQESFRSTASESAQSNRDPNRVTTDNVKLDEYGKPHRGTDAHQLLAKIGREDFSGASSGVYMGMQWKASFQFSGKTVTGTLKIVAPSGKQEIHYGRGTFDNGVVEASDNLGFRFSGRVTDNFKLVGTMTTSDGKSVSVDIPLDQ